MARCNPKPLRWRNVLGAVSFLICAWTIFQAVAASNSSLNSDFDLVYLPKDGRVIEFGHHRGLFYFSWDTWFHDEMLDVGWNLRPSFTAQMEHAGSYSPTGGAYLIQSHQLNLLGFNFSICDWKWGPSYPATPAYKHGFDLTLPAWLIISITGMLPAGMMLKRFRTNDPLNRFYHRGYDLRATLNRCPECGHYGTPRIEPTKSRIGDYATGLRTREPTRAPDNKAVPPPTKSNRQVTAVKNAG